MAQIPSVSSPLEISFSSLPDEIKVIVNTPFHQSNKQKMDEQLILYVLQNTFEEFKRMTISNKKFLFSIILDRINKTITARFDFYEEPIITDLKAKKIYHAINNPDSNEDTTGFMERTKFPENFVVMIVNKETQLKENVIAFIKDNGQFVNNIGFDFVVGHPSRSYVIGNMLVSYGAFKKGSTK